MKKILLFLFLSIVAFACNDSDTDENNPVIGDEIIIKNDADAKALTSGVYGPLQTISSSYSFVLESATEGTISFEGEENADGPLISRFEIKDNNWYAIKLFSRLYTSIGAANDAIEKISATPDSIVTPAAKRLNIGTAKFIRALNYSYLVQLYGEVPLILATTDSKNLTRTSIDKVYEAIVEDLEEAESLLDAGNTTTTPTKGAVQGLLARVYLSWGSHPLTQADVETIKTATTDPANLRTFDEGKLKLAVEYADKVISSGFYSLREDYTKLFGKAYESQAPEHIFTIHHDGDAYDAQGNHQTHCAFTFPFELTKDNHIGPSDVDLYNNWPHGDADSRKEWSYTRYVTNPLNDSTYFYWPPFTLPRFGKGVDRSYPNSVNINTNEIDRIELRYAEVLLIKAEALVQLGKAGEALAPINQVRTRAFGNTNYNLTGTPTLAQVQQEWRYEFVYEQKHWLNLVRWKTLIETVKTVKDFEHFDDKYKDPEATYNIPDGKYAGDHKVDPFFAKVHKHLHAKYDNVKGLHYRLPIPQGENYNDLGITPQNPGY